MCNYRLWKECVIRASSVCVCICEHSRCQDSCQQYKSLRISYSAFHFLFCFVIIVIVVVFLAFALFHLEFWPLQNTTLIRGRISKFKAPLNGLNKLWRLGFSHYSLFSFAFVELIFPVTPMEITSSLLFLPLLLSPLFPINYSSNSRSSAISELYISISGPKQNNNEKFLAYLGSTNYILVFVHAFARVLL